MIKKATLLSVLLATTAGLHADTPLLSNTNFDGFDEWIIGSNTFSAGNWVAFVQAPEAYAYTDRLQPSGDGFVFSSWDDGESDRIETYLFQEFLAGPDASAWPTIFETGDVIRFTGRASANVSDDDVIARAFIKVLGYNELGWEFQTKEEYSAFFDLTSQVQEFDLSVVYPDLLVDDSLQVLQIGFELTTLYDGTSMDTGSIYFEDVAGYIEGEGGTEMWGGYPVEDGTYVNTGAWIGYIDIRSAPFVYSFTLNQWVYLPEEWISELGGWAYLMK